MIVLCDIHFRVIVEKKSETQGYHMSQKIQKSKNKNTPNLPLGTGTRPSYSRCLLGASFGAEGNVVEVRTFMVRNVCLQYRVAI